MAKMTIELLNQIKNQYIANIEKSKIHQEASYQGKYQVLVCASTGCISNNSKDVLARFEKKIKEAGIANKCDVVQTGCHGLCEMGPVVIIYPQGAFYAKVQPSDVDKIVEQHLVKGEVVKEKLFWDSFRDGKLVPLSETGFYKKQIRIALKNSGIINPERIEEYFAADGYQALYKVLSGSREDVIKIIKESGLRGRGGGGFPTGTKWELAYKAIGKKKYVCCNGDEGDPGAFMDRSVLEADPHSIIEAMAIAGYAIGADEGYIYVRAEYPVAVKRLEIAIKQATKYGLLGKDIFGKGFNFKLTIRLGSGAFVCGEETALMTSVEGNRGEPRPRPPYPANSGLYQCPTVLNNVETYANVPRIILNGSKWFSSIGTEKSKGTKVFALGGKIKNTGLIEVPMGITLKEIIYEIGGGILGGGKFKAAQTGGPSGGCIPNELINTPIDYDNLIAIGSMMGSGGLIVMDESSCMVDICKFYMEFCADESCGKCVPCRIGNKRLLELLTDITEGRGKKGDVERLQELCMHIKSTSLCGLGQTAPNPILSTIRYFRSEYDAHVIDHRCPAGVCSKLLQYTIDPNKCKKCSLCARQCPVKAISGEVGKTPFVIDQTKCIKCGACMGACKFNAIDRK
ncbi:MAG: NADH-quinone oxidoreductase subunit NuoF [Mycoplasmataceae bacterium]|nr:NADH-quinone oxidoreductase subunit NuoF [Mycoplasmataceae bacterium]